MINKFFIRDSITRCLRLVSFPQGKVLRMNTFRQDLSSIKNISLALLKQIVHLNSKITFSYRKELLIKFSITCCSHVVNFLQGKVLCIGLRWQGICEMFNAWSTLIRSLIEKIQSLLCLRPIVHSNDSLVWRHAHKLYTCFQSKGNSSLPCARCQGIETTMTCYIKKKPYISSYILISIHAYTV